MARSLDDRQQAELTAFVNAIAEAAGYETTAEWARDSGYAYPNLTNLRNGKGAVDGYNLFRLIRAAAARTDITVDQLALGIAQATAEGTSDYAVDLRLAQLNTQVGEALELLRSGSRRGPIEVAEDLVTRLDAGETVPMEQLQTLARSLDETSDLCGRLADRLREADEVGHSGS
jgi:hypothetical protein